MVKRTGETVLTIIGALIYALFAALGFLTVWLFNKEEAWQSIQNEFLKQNPQLNRGDMEAIVDVAGTGGWLLAIISIVCVILGIVAIMLMKGNKKPVAAGVILLIAAIGGALITFGAAIFSGLFYLIAGIMCLVRKPPKPVVEETRE